MAMDPLPNVEGFVRQNGPKRDADRPRRISVLEASITELDATGYWLPAEPPERMPATSDAQALQLETLAKLLR
jgi:hypothetical protein